MISGGVLLLEVSQNIASLEVVLGVLGKFIQLFGQYLFCCRVHTIGSPGDIHLDVGGKLLVVHNIPKYELYRDFIVGQYCDRF